jgi:hypothetical protein
VAEVERFREMSREFWRIWGEEGADELAARYEDFFAPDAVWAPPTGQVAGRMYVGRDGFAEYVEDYKELFVSFTGDLDEDSVELVGDLLLRTRVSVVATLRAGGAIDATLHTVTKTDAMRMTYAWGTYEPDAAERKIGELRAEAEELQAGQETADA